MFYDAVIWMAGEILKMVLITLISILGTWLAVKFAGKKGLDNIAAATNEAVDAAKRVVEELQQTTVNAMKAAHEDGKLSQSEIEHLGALLLEKALAQMSAPAIKILNAAGKDISAIIQSAGEAAVLKMKQK